MPERWRPKIFIASSGEAKPMAEALAAVLAPARCTVWDKSFGLSSATMAELITRTSENDFAIMFFVGDDSSRIRGEEHRVVRDNVVLECGLFTGALSLDRTFIVSPDDRNLHFPTDLAGLTSAFYDTKWARQEPRKALGQLKATIDEGIAKSSWTKLALQITATANAGGASYPLKLWFRLKNPHKDPVLIESLAFELDPSLKATGDSRLTADGKYALLLRTGEDTKGQDIRANRCVLEPGGATTAWLAIEPSVGQARLQQAINERKVGTWRYRCCWLDDRIGVCRYEENF